MHFVYFEKLNSSCENINFKEVYDCTELYTKQSHLTDLWHIRLWIFTSENVRAFGFSTPKKADFFNFKQIKTCILFTTTF